MGKVSYKLKCPVKYTDTETISELNFRDHICAGDLRGIKLSALADLPVDDLMKIAARLSGQTEPAMTKIDWVDVVGIVEVVGGFLVRGLSIGTTDSQT